MKVHWRILLAVILVFAFATVSLAYERSETLVYGGGLWGAPSNWNPLTPWAEVTGTGGLVYEKLFHYYPLSNEYQPWLAESGEWVTDNTYLITLRKGIKWTDGEEFNAEDVKFTFEIAKDNPLHYSNIWDWLTDIEVVDSHKLMFIFDNPHYQEWKQILYDLRIIPEHIWSKIPADELLTTANENPVGTGPYMADSWAQDRMIWVRNEDWWGNEVFGKPAPKNLVNLVVSGNNVALGMLMKRELDLSNFFIPGVPKIKDTFGLTTWYKGAPYMLSENVALLFLNTTKKPLDDVKLRRAMAFAINPEMISEKVFEEQVQVADPTGLFGKAWMEYHSEDVVDEYGFSYDPAKAKEMLEQAGYVDADGDGWRDAPDGTEMRFEIIVPNGWTDWMESIKIIANNLQEVGINAVPGFPDYSIYMDKIQQGTFDMVINNFGSSRSATPFTYWNWVASDEINGEIVTDGNYSRYDDPELFNLIDEFNVLQSDDPRAMEVAAEIQKKLLQAMPSIPLWYNGLWAQSTSQYWTNWPTENNPEGYPCTWAGKWQYGSIEMLINLKPAQ
ncbi:MAG: peptide/nickel transport system substrate-binding protein [Halanaerobiales bacterium]|nr:peptide/nickel transport system substrate-binding protein [Halanaerobiales bacterium]